jgi:mono/diheme cytochrome c family protein
MRRTFSLRVGGLCSTWAVALLGAAHVASGATAAAPARERWPLTAAALLSAPIADSAPNAVVLRRGQYLVAAGDCMSCHLRDGGEPLAGGLALNTPFGVIYTPNITPDRDTGIGAWNADQFYRAMHDGIGVHGENLYPAFPYPSFRRANRVDDDAIFAYLQSIPAVHYTRPQNDLRFPLNFRFVVKFWNLFFLRSQEWNNDATQSAEWNRGAYLVEGLGHCGECHTPKNWLGADEASRALEGAPLDNGVAPDLTGNERTGLGAWSSADIDEYLANGRNPRAGAGAAMGEVVTYSTALMTDADRLSIAAYLKSRRSSRAAPVSSVQDATMLRGAAIYSDVCASCHLAGGVGQPGVFPPLGGNAMLQQADPTGLEHIILAGARTGTSPTRRSPLSMPSFAWKLSDAEIADVGTYLRQSWGNQASALTPKHVHGLRTALGLERIKLTANSGDRNDAEP